jgi:NADH:ubiquinone oxidoreductase subunit 6 (subunit J)
MLPPPEIILIAIAALMLSSAALAVSLRNLIHSALLFVLNWIGVAFFYLWAGVEFVAFAQVLVYAGAVSMIVLFAVLLTRRRAAPATDPRRWGRVLSGVLAAAATFVLIAWAIHKPTPIAQPAADKLPPTVRAIGHALAGPQIPALLITGVLLTATLVGAALIASPLEKTEETK